MCLPASTCFDVVDCQDLGGFSAQLESQLLIRHVTADSFRTFTIFAENEVSTSLRNVRLLTRGLHVVTLILSVHAD